MRRPLIDEFVECDSCAKKPGSPTLCGGCLHNRNVAAQLMKEAKRDQTDLQFYDPIEEGVRPYVRLLRNAGLNTECSCHHDGTIQCQSLDPTTEIDRIRRAFFGKVHKYTIEVTYQQTGNDAAYWHQTLVITSPFFKYEVKKEAK